MSHIPDPVRYNNTALYRACGRSGLKLPRLSLGFWHYFGDDADQGAGRALVLKAFDLGITHFDLANAYGPPRGSAESNITPAKLAQVRQLDALAKARGQSLAQMALAWVLRQPVVTSALIGASQPAQLEENLGALKGAAFTAQELAEIDRILG